MFFSLSDAFNLGILTEVDMGMTYQELTIFGRLRKLNKLGPLGMFQRLVHDWSVDRARRPDDDGPYYTPVQVAEKVKKFFHFYAINSMLLRPQPSKILARMDS